MTYSLIYWAIPKYKETPLRNSRAICVESFIGACFGRSSRGRHCESWYGPEPHDETWFTSTCLKNQFRCRLPKSETKTSDIRNLAFLRPNCIVFTIYSANLFTCLRPIQIWPYFVKKSCTRGVGGGAPPTRNLNPPCNILPLTRHYKDVVEVNRVPWC